MDHCAMFLRVGAGKTVIALTLAEYYLRTGQVNRVLVLGPKRVVNNVWHTEAKEWEHLQHLTFTNMVGGRQAILEGFGQDTQIHLINIDNFTKLLERYGREWPYDMIIWDEYSGAKHQKSRRARAMWDIMRAKACKKFLGLTGTPASNGLQDVWNLIRILDGGRRLGRYKSHFEAKYMYVPASQRNNPHAKLQMMPGASEAIYDKIKDVAFSMPDHEYPRQEEPTHNRIMVDLPPDTRRLYDQIEKGYLAKLKDGEYLSVETAAVASIKMLQITSGAVYTENPEFEELHQTKLDALEELVEESNGRPLLVFQNFKFNRERILERFPQAVALQGEDDEALDAWNAGFIPMLVANPQGAGHGLNLQYGGSDTVWFDLTWNLEHFNQANGRLDRTGQKNQVIQHYIMARDSMDEEVMDRLMGKMSVEQALMHALQRHE